MVSHSGLITVMDRAARKAAPRLRRDFNEVQQLQVSRKGPADFVSMADRRAEEPLYEELKRARPDWGFVMEEGGEIEGDPDKPRWIIDPLDGTSNFLHGLPHFAISIAVEEPRTGHKRGEVTQGLVYQPLTDESFWAEKGRGAWLQDRRLRVSARRDLSEALVATGIPFLGHGDIKQWTSIFASVAAGRYDAFWESDLQIWDVAAGILLVREAGGFVSDFRGGDRMHERNEYLATNDGLATKIHKLVAQGLKAL